MLEGRVADRELGGPPLTEGSHHPDWFSGVIDEFVGEIADPRARGRNLAQAAICVQVLALARESSRRAGGPLASRAWPDVPGSVSVSSTSAAAALVLVPPEGPASQSPPDRDRCWACRSSAARCSRRKRAGFDARLRGRRDAGGADRPRGHGSAELDSPRRPPDARAPAAGTDRLHARPARRSLGGRRRRTAGVALETAADRPRAESTCSAR